MSDEIEHWKRMARRVIPERDAREVKREKIVRGLDWSSWSQREKEVYAAAFLFPDPEIAFIDNHHVDGVSLKLKGFARTQKIVDPDGNVWLVIEGGRPEML